MFGHPRQTNKIVGVEECVLDYIALHIEYRFNKNLLLRSYVTPEFFSRFWQLGGNIFLFAEFRRKFLNLIEWLIA